MEMMTHVQILDKAVYISLNSNSFGEGMNTSVLSLVSSWAD